MDGTKDETGRALRLGRRSWLASASLPLLVSASGNGSTEPPEASPRDLLIRELKRRDCRFRPYPEGEFEWKFSNTVPDGNFYRDVDLSKKVTPELLQRFVELFPEVAKVSVNSTTPDELRTLQQLPILSEVAIWEWTSSPAIIEVLANWLNLRLKICDRELTDGEIGALVKSLPRATLNTGKGATPEGLKCATESHMLEDCLLELSATDAEAMALAGSRRLRHLMIVSRNVGDGSAELFSHLPHLLTLHLSDTSHGTKSLHAIAKLPRLHMLTLQNLPIDDEAVVPLAQSSIFYLSIGHCSISPEVVEKISLASRLGGISLEGSEFTDRHVLALGIASRKWEGVSIKSRSVTDHGFAWLGEAEALEGLGIEYTRATPATLMAVPNPSQLKSLSLGGPFATRELLAAAQRFPNLLVATLTGSSIDDRTVDSLPLTVKTLTLSHTRVSFQALSNLLRRQALEYVDFVVRPDSQYVLTDEQVKELNSLQDAIVNQYTFGT